MHDLLKPFSVTITFEILPLAIKLLDFANSIIPQLTVLLVQFEQNIFEYLTLLVRFFVREENVYLLSVYKLTIFKSIFAGKYLARLQ